jgi:hypothetical protein
VKKTILFSLIFLAGITAYSQTSKEAEKLLDRISQRYKNSKPSKLIFFTPLKARWRR